MRKRTLPGFYRRPTPMVVRGCEKEEVEDGVDLFAHQVIQGYPAYELTCPHTEALTRSHTTPPAFPAPTPRTFATPLRNARHVRTVLRRARLGRRESVIYVDLGFRAILGSSVFRLHAPSSEHPPRLLFEAPSRWALGSTTALHKYAVVRGIKKKNGSTTASAAMKGGSGFRVQGLGCRV